MDADTEISGERVSDIILRDELWKDRQRGGVEHHRCHPLYARHMYPMFLATPKGMKFHFLYSLNLTELGRVPCFILN
jgi:hypothetical protein